MKRKCFHIILAALLFAMVFAIIRVASDMANIKCKGVVVEVGEPNIFGTPIAVESVDNYKNGHVYRLFADGYSVDEHVIMTINPGDRQGAQDDSVINIRHAD